MAETFFDRLRRRAAAIDSLLCVGLDPDPATLSGDLPMAALAQNRRIIEATADLALAYKPNSAFYEALGPAGMGVLGLTLAAIPPDIPVILDAKRGDIGSTSVAYARAVFDVLQVDAVTVHPYLGRDGLAPFLERADRGVFILCRTSNPGARDLQDVACGDELFYQRVARLAATWNERGNVGLVVGATYPAELAWLRAHYPDMWFLAPGIGPQGADVETALRAGLNLHGDGLLISVSRAIATVPNPREVALSLVQSMRRVRSTWPSGIHPQISDREQLILDLHHLGCIQFGAFTLKSGQTSPIYLDLRRIIADPLLLGRVARLYVALLAPLHYDRLAGIPYAGLPIVTAVSLETGRPFIYPRKEVKEYGTRQAVEGAFFPGETVVIVDDVVTTGGSKLEAVAPLMKEGLHVHDVVVLIDRQQGAAEALAAQGLRLHAAYRLREIVDILRSYGRISSEQADAVHALIS